MYCVRVSTYLFLNWQIGVFFGWKVMAKTAGLLWQIIFPIQHNHIMIHLYINWTQVQIGHFSDPLFLTKPYIQIMFCLNTCILMGTSLAVLWSSVLKCKILSFLRKRGLSVFIKGRGLYRIWVICHSVLPFVRPFVRSSYIFVSAHYL